LTSAALRSGSARRCVMNAAGARASAARASAAAAGIAVAAGPGTADPSQACTGPVMGGSTCRGSRPGADRPRRHDLPRAYKGARPARHKAVCGTKLLMAAAATRGQQQALGSNRASGRRIINSRQQFSVGASSLRHSIASAPCAGPRRVSERHQHVRHPGQQLRHQRMRTDQLILPQSRHAAKASTTASSCRSESRGNRRRCSASQHYRAAHTTGPAGCQATHGAGTPA